MRRYLNVLKSTNQWQRNVPGELEPIAAVGYPPGDEQDGNSRGYAPPERQDEVGDQAEPNEQHPEYFAFHGFHSKPAAKYRAWFCSSLPDLFVVLAARIGLSRVLAAVMTARAKNEGGSAEAEANRLPSSVAAAIQ
jgi:hypothetical protein